jgi:hypothetical protein
MTTTKATAKMTDHTVTAEEAPIGQLLWPVRDAKYAPNFTLDRVSVIREADATYVEWRYESGNVRHFPVGEQVACRW